MSIVLEEKLVVEDRIVKVVKKGVPQKFHVLPKAGPGKQEVIEAKAFTKSVRVNQEGRVKLVIDGLNGTIRTNETYYFVRDGVLYAKKKHRHYATNSFALNYRVAMALDWDVCFVVSSVAGEAGEFVSTKDEWMTRGIVDQYGEEVQLAMEVERYRILPSGSLTKGLIDISVVNWLRST